MENGNDWENSCPDKVEPKDKPEGKDAPRACEMQRHGYRHGYPYLLDNLEYELEGIDKALAVIRKDRGKRYGGARDILRNVRLADPDHSWRGAYISAKECMNRLENMFFKHNDEIDCKDFENATDDLINYAKYIKILQRHKRIEMLTDCEKGGC